MSQCGSKIRCKHCGRKHHSSSCSPCCDEPKQATHRDETQRVTSNNDSQLPAHDTSLTTHATLTPVSHDTGPSEQVLHVKSVTFLQTAIAPVHVGHINTLANILFDEGAQRSFITEDLAVKLQLQSFTTEHIAVASFGTNTLANRQLPVAQVQVETQLGELIPISVLVVPVIITPLHNTVRSCITRLPYLQGLKMAHPVTGEDNFQISLLIGADFYCSFVEDDIIHGDGPTAQQSKLGYLLSGPMLQQSSTVSALHISTLPPDIKEPSLEVLWSLEYCGHWRLQGLYPVL